MKNRNHVRRLILNEDAAGIVVNPFVSEAQRRACYAAKDPGWDCGEWEDATPGVELPEHKTGKASTGKVGKRKRRLTANRLRHGRRPARTPARNPIKADPTRTMTLRRAFVNRLRKRFALLKGRIVRYFADDTLGLGKGRPAASPSTPSQPSPTANNPGQIRDESGLYGPGVGIDVPRSEMPQIGGDDLDDFIRWAMGRDAPVSLDEVPADSLRPTQSRYKQSKVDGMPDEFLSRPVIVSLDYHVLDGTHRWVKAWQKDPSTPVPVVRVGLPVREAVGLMRAFPGVSYAANAGSDRQESELHDRLRVVAEEAKDRKDSPDYGQMFFNSSEGHVWYVTADGDEEPFARWVADRLEQVPLVQKVTVEAEAFPKGEEWVQVYPGWRSRARYSANAFCPTGAGGGVDPSCSLGGSDSPGGWKGATPEEHEQFEASLARTREWANSRGLDGDKIVAEVRRTYHEIVTEREEHPERFTKADAVGIFSHSANEAMNRAHEERYAREEKEFQKLKYEQLVKPVPAPPKFGQSEARVQLVSRRTPEQVQRIITSTFGDRTVTPQDIATLVGAPKEAKVSITPGRDANSLTVRVDHPDYVSKRTIRLTSAYGGGPQTVVRNDEFWVKPGSQGKGLGVEVFGRQVEKAQELGVSRIECHAAKSNPNNPTRPHNGYYTWPRFGYDQSVSALEWSNPSLAGKVKEKFPHARSVLDVMMTREGQDWWKQNGSDLTSASFDLRPGSRSLRVFHAYLAERADRPSRSGTSNAESLPEGRGVEGIDLTPGQEAQLERAWGKRRGHPADFRTENQRYAAYVYNGHTTYFPQEDPAGGHPLVGVPDVRQHDAYSCGAAVAMSVGRYFGVGPESITEWKELLGTDRKDGTDPAPIVSTLANLGLVVQDREGMTLDDLGRATTDGSPVIVAVQDWGSDGTAPKESDTSQGHYLIVLGVSQGYVFAQDPAAPRPQGGIQAPGRVMIEEDRFDSLWHDEDADGRGLEHWGAVVTGTPVGNWNPDQERDEHGRFGSGSGTVSSDHTSPQEADTGERHSDAELDRAGVPRSLFGKIRSAVSSVRDAVHRTAVRLSVASLAPDILDTIQDTQRIYYAGGKSQPQPLAQFGIPLSAGQLTVIGSHVLAYAFRGARAGARMIFGSGGATSNAANEGLSDDPVIELADAYFRALHDAVPEMGRAPDREWLAQHITGHRLPAPEVPAVPAPSTNAAPTYDHEKLESFQEWLKTQVGSLLTSDDEEALWEAYVRQGFLKGAGRSFDDVKKSQAFKAGLADKLDFYEGTREQFLSDSFAQPVAAGKVKLIAARSFDELENVTDDMANRMSRTLADGLVRGASPHDIADDLEDDLGFSAARAETVARTEVIRAHAEGQLLALEDLGVEEVGVAVEWSTTGDDKVCELCDSLEGVVLKVSEAHGLLPRHPNCRCAFLPANVGEDKEDRKDTKAQIDSALEDADLDPDEVGIGAKRPKSIFNVRGGSVRGESTLVSRTPTPPRIYPWPVVRRLTAPEVIANYRADQPRDSWGRWVGGIPEPPAGMEKVKVTIHGGSQASAHKRLRAIYDAVRAMSPAARKRIAAAMPRIHLHHSFKEITGAWVSQGNPLQAGHFVAGFYDPDSGHLHVDGGHKESGQLDLFTLKGVVTHELGHAIDGKVSVHSDSKGWRAAFKAEIDQPNSPLSAYARTDRSEGFAEFSRLLHTGKDAKAIEVAFPKCWAYWKKNGLLPK